MHSQNYLVTANWLGRSIQNDLQEYSGFMNKKRLTKLMTFYNEITNSVDEERAVDVVYLKVLTLSPMISSQTKW